MEMEAAELNSEDCRFYPRLVSLSPLNHLLFCGLLCFCTSFSFSASTFDILTMAAVSSIPCLLRTSSRTLSRMRKPLVQIPALRSVSTKHPTGFVPPTEDDLTELRESVREFTSE